MISRPQRLRLVRAVLAGDPDPPVYCKRDSNTRTQGEDYGVEPNSRAVLTSYITIREGSKLNSSGVTEA